MCQAKRNRSRFAHIGAPTTPVSYPAVNTAKCPWDIAWAFPSPCAFGHQATFTAESGPCVVSKETPPANKHTLAAARTSQGKILDKNFISGPISSPVPTKGMIDDAMKITVQGREASPGGHSHQSKLTREQLQLPIREATLDFAGHLHTQRQHSLHNTVRIGATQTESKHEARSKVRVANAS